MKIHAFLISVLFMMAIVVFAADAEHTPHSTITYIIVPRKDVTGEMLKLVAQESKTARPTVSEIQASPTNAPSPGAAVDLVLLSFVLHKKPTDPMPALTPNDKVMTAKDLEYNDEKMSQYAHAHKATPVLLRAYEQYSHAEIKVELEKADWAR